MKKKIGVGIIGFGTWGETFHLPAIQATKMAEVVAVYDTNLRRGERALKLGIKTYASLTSFLKDPKVEVVVIVTPHNTHFPLAMRAIAASKHIILEKPMTLNATEAKKIMEAAKQNNCLLTVFHNRRFDGDFLAINRLVSSGKLGRIYTIQSRIQLWGSPAGFGTKDFYPEWRDEKAYGGGGLLDWGVHLVDQLLQFPLGKPKRVTAKLQSGTFAKDCDDFALALLEFDSGALSIVEVNFVTNYPLPRWLITAEKGSIILHHNERVLRLFNPQLRIERHIQPERNRWEKIFLSFFRKILGTADKLAVEPQTVVKTMRILDLIRKSAKTGKTIAL